MEGYVKNTGVVRLLALVMIRISKLTSSKYQGYKLSISKYSSKSNFQTIIVTIDCYPLSSYQYFQQSNLIIYIQRKRSIGITLSNYDFLFVFPIIEASSNTLMIITFSFLYED